MSEGAEKIRRLSRVLMGVCVLAVAVIVVAIPRIWLVLGRPDFIRAAFEIPSAIPVEVPDFWLRLACFAVASLVFGPVLYAFAQLWLVLRQFGRGVFFDRGNVARLRRLGWAIIAASVGNCVFNVAVLELLTLGNAPSLPAVYRTIVSGLPIGLFAGGIVLLIARVLDVARVINDDNQQII
jgi:hypothetical protein